LACKRDPMVRDRDETETFDFQSKTRSRPRPSPVSTRPRRDQDVWKLRLKTVSRPRRRDRDYIPGYCMVLERCASAKLCGVVSSRNRAAIPFDVGRLNCLV